MLRSVTGPASTSEQYGPIVSVAFHPAGQYLAYVNGRRDDRLAEPVEIRLWAFKTQSKPRTLKRLAATIHQLLIEPSGRYLVTAGDDGAVRFHEIATGWEERVYRHPGKALSMALSPTRDRLAVTTHEGALFMWNLADLQGERQYGQHEKSVTRLAVSPDGKLAATADGNAILHLWSVKDRQQRWKVDTKQDFVETVGFTPDGKYCFTGGRDQCVRFWNTTDGSLHHALLAHPGTVLKDPRDAEERPVFVHTAVMHPDGRWLITGGDDRLLRVFDIATWTEVREPIRRTNPVGVVAISPDGRWIAAGVHLDGAFLWDTTHAWREHAIHLDSPVASIHALAFSPDSLRLAIAYGEGKLEIYDAQSQELVCTCKGHEANVVAIAYHPDGHRLASASKDTHVKLWHARTGVEILSLEGHEGEVRGLSFADNGNKLISTSWDATVRIWDATPLP
jgi:WD40 repeat protein